MPYIVAMDARVLLPTRAQTEVALLHVASETAIFQLRWSAEIMEDLRVLFRREYPDAESSIIEGYIARLNGDEFGLDAMVVPHPLLVRNEHVGAELAPHALHVVEAAVRGGAGAILTTEQEDYTGKLVEGFVVHTVDEFLCSRLRYHQPLFTSVFDGWVQANRRRGKGPRSVAALIDQLEAGAPQFARAARGRLLAHVKMPS